ncbi:MAG: multifunctional oxoglutarate decarboxylase/oxoglutarate dehydrogenase thiamine pyrophosphate-binding subunit/dihydrolipoyllysine-residue succinyltransferase subunit [Actinobacteria bacterium]|nr:multifunctional oxoglutarate decarboxylase/oxoglutarate dehydrogenase thiamine pyrophosphate-binding subunit/dihydrolipoyllysine-residue succinyltransferase subunit [Actinomycetota bacterium]
MADEPSPRSAAELNRWLVEDLYEQYREDPESLSPSWRAFFEDYRSEDRVEGEGETVSGNGQARTAAEQDRGTEPEEAPVERPSTAEPSEAEQADEAEGQADEPEEVEEAPTPQRLRGVQATIVRNMQTSLTVPTATSVRDVPAKLLEINRRIINNHLGRTRGGKVSFTHLIAFAILKAVAAVPAMKRQFHPVDDDKPGMLLPDHVNLGLAVDVERDDGTRILLVPNIKRADTLDFQEFLDAYEDVIRRIRTNKLDPEMFAGTSLTITNPGMIGTVLSVPRLMEGQSAIIGVGNIDYPPEYEAADPHTVARLGLSKVVTLTSTYDHRVIQGAESGQFLQQIHGLLLGDDGFYEEVFRAIGVPYTPARWKRDVSPLDSERAALEKQKQVDALAHMHRVRGHLIANLDPLSAKDPALHPELDPTFYGLSIWDLDREFLVDGVNGNNVMTLGDLLGVLRDAYCRTVGIEYMHIQDPDQKSWIRERVEGTDTTLDTDDQLHILRRLNDAEAFERFLHTKYVGQKRFGIEGGESLIPLLDAVCESAADEPLEGIVMGMAHRGRLNVLSNIVGKKYAEIFREFEGDIEPDTVQGSGDVKYHLGTSGTFQSRRGNSITIALPPNPSHLEAVDPVVEGMARAMEDRLDRGEEFPILPLLLHGDAAFSGQGVVAETLNLSQLRGYRTGGTVHVVINNQVGFTATAEAARSSQYATDVARMVQAPIFHVNGDDPEACVRVARLAFEYRQRFQADVVIDMICYRRHGHNEADDPSFTQPLMYHRIEEKRSVRKLYTERLVKRGDISIEQAEEYLEDFEQRLQTAFDRTKESSPPEPPKARKPDIVGVLTHVDTGVPRETLEHIASKQFGVPDGLTRHPKLERIFKREGGKFEEGRIDWPLAETLSFGSMLLEGINIRLAGQDSRRGTFSQRHAVQVDYHTGEEYLPLADLSDDQGKWFIYDSLLSEYAALGFEFGYSVADKDTLVIWEAQFGDFANGAQIVIDEFIVAAEDKWDETSGLVLLLPHGYEGQGPDHSSARIERFLTLCAEDNIQVVNATTAAQYFHVLRRQMHRDVRKPLIVFTPKSLLRSKDAVSDIAELTSGSFRETLDDDPVPDREAVTQVVLCSGKVAYEAMAQRGERDLDGSVAVVRVEQIYPWPDEQLTAILRDYPEARDVVWLQEEPRNMGPWGFVDGRLWNILGDLADGRELRCVSRIESASPASGSHVVHEQEQAQLFDELYAR